MLVKTRWFTAVAIVTLALAIGANAAILSTARGMFYRPLPYRDPGALGVIWGKDVKRGWTTTQTSISDFQVWQQRVSSFESMTAFTWTDYRSFALASNGAAERVRGIAVLPDFLETLGERPFAGRGFLLEEFRGEHRVALMSYALWQSQFGGDPAIVGRAIRLNREPYTVTGVLPKDFEIPVLDDAAQIIVPLRVDSTEAMDRKQRLLIGVGRLRAGHTFAAARAELETSSTQLAHDHAEDTGFTASLQSLRDAEGLQSARQKLPIFLWTVGALLIVAAANVAGILLSRFAARRPELVVRSALGASRLRLTRQMLTEALMLSLIAGALSILIYQWAAELLLSYKPFYIPFEPHVTLDWFTILTVLSISVAVGFLFGLFPSLTIARTDLRQEISRTGARGAAWLHDQFRNALLVAEIALSIALLTGAGLMTNTVARISRINIGFDPKDLCLARISLDRTLYPSEANQLAFFFSLVERLGSRRGVIAATGASHFCNYDPSGWCIGNPIRIPDNPVDRAKDTSTTVVMPGFFSAIRMPILRGREFRENESAPVAVVDQTFVDQFFPDRDPIGQPIELLQTAMHGDLEVKAGLRTIVGVVPPVRRISYGATPFPQIYVPFSQNPVSSMFVVVRGPELAGAAAIRAAVAALDSELPVYRSATMRGWIDRFYGSQRFELLILAAFSGVALLISASGLYAVISHRVVERTREMGIRLALGATRANIEWVVLRQTAILIGSGAAAGIAAAGVLGQLISKFIYGVSPRDPLMLGLTCAVVLFISIAAVYIPARRASRMDPLTALRHQ
jgi:putative ABC transport system permease protein